MLKKFVAIAADPGETERPWPGRRFDGGSQG